MKILFITSVIPYPLDEGGKVAQFSFLQYYNKYFKGTLICEARSDIDVTSCLKLQKALPNINIKYFRNGKDSEVNSLRATAINFLDKAHFRIYKFLRDLRRINHTSNSILDSDVFINPVRPKSKSFIDFIASVLKNDRYDLVQVDFIDNSDLAIVLPSATRKVLVLHDLRYSSIDCLKSYNVNNNYLSYLSQYTQKIEFAFASLFDGIVTFSEQDKNRLANLKRITSIESIPFAVLDSDTQMKLTPLEEIDKLVFLGPEHHAPNKDALMWFIEEIRPLMRREIPLHIIGIWNAETVKKLEIAGQIIFHGFVENPGSVFKNSIMISPLRIGSGIRTKILAAFAKGVPVVSTSIGCEGLSTMHGTHISIADTPSEFVKEIYLLYDNSNYRNKIRKEALAHIRVNFSQKSIYNRRMAFYEAIDNNKYLKH